MTKLEKARKFCYEVGELAKKYNLPVFVVTDGASLTRNNGNTAVRFHREKQIEWENQNNFDPNEDWGSSFEAIKSYINEIKNDISIEKMSDRHMSIIVELMDKATEYHMGLSSEFERYIKNEDPNYHQSNINHLKNRKNVTIIAKNSSDIVGYIMYRDNGDHIRCMDFYVEPEFRGSGVGYRLMDYVVKRRGNKPVTLTCLKENRLGYRFYTRYGFKVDKTDTGKKYHIVDYIMSYNKEDK